LSTISDRTSLSASERRGSTPLPQRASVPDSQVEEEECLVADTRADLTPAEMVERKLFSLLKEGPVPISYLRMAPLCRGRGVS
jgi:hypothetical protein